MAFLRAAGRCPPDNLYSRALDAEEAAAEELARLRFGAAA